MVCICNPATLEYPAKGEEPERILGHNSDLITIQDSKPNK